MVINIDMSLHTKKLDRRSVIAHVIYRLQVGGLENGLVNLINNMPEEKYRHVIICLTEITSFKERIKNDSVEYYTLEKKAGNDLGSHYRLWKLLRKIRPVIMHTRNIGTIEYSLTGKLAGVKYCIHGEHGRDMTDIDGSNYKYIYIRRILSPFINKFIALSGDLENWLIKKVKIPKRKVLQLYNGVDTNIFFPDINRKSKLTDKYTKKLKEFKIGTVGRFSAEKDQLTLVKAFKSLLSKNGLQHINFRLILIGEGPLKSKIIDLLHKSGIEDKTEMPGESKDIPSHLRNFDIFVLPSLGEGISNTILEAMACGLPVIATNVGGNPELVKDGQTGFLVGPANPEEIAEKLYFYINNPDVLLSHGKKARDRAENTFGLDKMVEKYVNVYDSLIMQT